jgi:hypothetical protein
MRFAVSHPSLFASAVLAAASLAGCNMTESKFSKEQFSKNITDLLAGKDQVVVEAGKLTDFPWARLCFERDDSLLLKFDRDGTESVLLLPYEEFFVDEGYVEHSLEDACLAPGDLILIKKKYPGYQGPIEFQKAAQGG